MNTKVFACIAGQNRRTGYATGLAPRSHRSQIVFSFCPIFNREDSIYLNRSISSFYQIN